MTSLITSAWEATCICGSTWIFSKIPQYSHSDLHERVPFRPYTYQVPDPPLFSFRQTYKLEMTHILPTPISQIIRFKLISISIKFELYSPHSG